MHTGRGTPPIWALRYRMWAWASVVDQEHSQCSPRKYKWWIRHSYAHRGGTLERTLGMRAMARHSHALPVTQVQYVVDQDGRMLESGHKMEAYWDLKVFIPSGKLTVLLHMRF